VLTPALAMSVPPRKPALQKQTDGYNLEQKTRKSALIIPFVF
jgi:hypothetical protein